MTENRWPLKPGRIHPGAGVGVVVVHDGSLLMIERAGADGAGTWSVPGGWVELWEDPLTTAIRETYEETGVTLMRPREAGWTNAPHHETGVHSITLWVRCDYYPGRSGEPTVKEPEKCPRVEWVPLGEVLDKPLFHPLGEWWPNQPEAIVEAEARRFCTMRDNCICPDCEEMYR